MANDLASVCRQWPILKQCKFQLLEQIRSFAVVGEEGQDVLLLCRDGSVYGYGRNRFGILGLAHKDQLSEQPLLIPELDANDIADIQHGMCHCLVLTKQGDVLCFGNNEFGQCAKTVSKLDYLTRPTKLVLPESEEKFSSVRCKRWYSVALTKSGVVYAWGDNDYGQIGVGHNSRQSSPVKVGAFGPSLVVTSIECGGGFCLALTNKGEVYGWGCNQFGQLGLGSSKVVHSVPVKVEVAEAGSFKAIAAGYGHSLLLSSDGLLFVCGDNRVGQLGCAGKPDWVVSPLKLANLTARIGSIGALCNLSVAMSETSQCFAWGEMADQDKVVVEPLQIDSTSIEQAFGRHLKERVTAGLVTITECSQPSLNPLLERISATFNQAEGSDLQFLVEGKTIHVNRGYLQLVAPTLAKTLSNANKSPIPITDHSHPVFHAYLRYLYTGQLEMPSPDLVIPLLHLSVSYQDSALTERCVALLRQSLTVSNCCQLYQLSRQHQLKTLEQSVVQFIQGNIGPVLSSDGYRDLDGDLCKSLVISLLPVLSPPPK